MDGEVRPGRGPPYDDHDEKEREPDDPTSDAASGSHQIGIVRRRQ
jgi:hypothetical protein